MKNDNTLLPPLTRLCRYWGSLWKAPVLTHQLRAWIIDNEGGPLGQAVSQAIMATTTSGSKAVLGWQQIDAAQFTTRESVIDAVVDERAWIAVVGAFNLTRKLYSLNLTSSSQWSRMLPTTLP
jgi:hypothetical protein